MSTRKINIGVVGATGVVGETFLNLLEERNFPVGDLKLFASQQSLGKNRKFLDREIELQILEESCMDGLDLVFFSSGDDISQEWAPKAVASGAYAVDNSAAFRMNPEIPLVVPEVNGSLLRECRQPCIIANPNCSTIQLVVAIHPLAQKFGLESVQVATYQSVSGAGRDAIDELISSTGLAIEGEDLENAKYFPAPIAFNCVPQIGGIDDQGFCTEELKIMRETKKILDLPQLSISAFTVRVPTLNAHAESVWVELKEDGIERDSILGCLKNADGIEVLENIKQYPTQKSVTGKNPTYVGRIHRDLNKANTWLMWVVSDNLRKGAALNGIQIAEHIFDLI